MITVTIAGLPQAWKRQGGAGKFRWSDSRANGSWTGTIRAAAAPLFPAAMEGPIRLAVVVVYPRTKGLAEVSKRTGEPRHPTDRVPKVSAPDLDNLIKGPQDALRGIAYHDDAAVVSYDGSAKWWAAMTRTEAGVWVQEQPHVLITVEALADGA